VAVDESASDGDGLWRWLLWRLLLPPVVVTPTVRSSLCRRTGSGAISSSSSATQPASPPDIQSLPVAAHPDDKRAATASDRGGNSCGHIDIVLLMSVQWTPMKMPRFLHTSRRRSMQAARLSLHACIAEGVYYLH
jgi:hypothetical protein